MYVVNKCDESRGLAHNGEPSSDGPGSDSGKHQSTKHIPGVFEVCLRSGEDVDEREGDEDVDRGGTTDPDSDSRLELWNAEGRRGSDRCGYEGE
jgi:hypothetical protein